MVCCIRMGFAEWAVIEMIQPQFVPCGFMSAAAGMAGCLQSDSQGLLSQPVRLVQEHPKEAFFFQDSPEGQPPVTANRHPLAVGGANRQPPSTANRQPLPTTTNRQPPTPANHHQPSTTNCQPPSTINCCSMLFPWSCGPCLDHEAVSIPMSFRFCWRYKGSPPPPLSGQPWAGCAPQAAFW